MRDKLRTAMAQWTEGAPIWSSLTPDRQTKSQTRGPDSPPPRDREATRPDRANRSRSSGGPAQRVEVYNNSPLAVVLPPGTIIEVSEPEKGSPAAKAAKVADWKQQMTERTERLKKLLKSKVDVWESL